MLRPALLGRGDGGTQAVGLAGRGGLRLSVSTELIRDCGELRIGLVQSGQGCRLLVAGLLQVAAGGLQGEPLPIRCCSGLRQVLLGFCELGVQGQQ